LANRKRLETFNTQTEICLLSGKKQFRPTTTTIEDKDIEIKKIAKYLGLNIDYQFYFGKHITTVTSTAEKKWHTLRRLLIRSGGPDIFKSKLLAYACESIILYACEIWKDATKMHKYKNLLLKTQRKFAIYITRSYRSANTENILVISGLIPLDIL